MARSGCQSLETIWVHVCVTHFINYLHFSTRPTPGYGGYISRYPVEPRPPQGSWDEVFVNFSKLTYRYGIMPIFYYVACCCPDPGTHGRRVQMPRPRGHAQITMHLYREIPLNTHVVPSLSPEISTVRRSLGRHISMFGMGEWHRFGWFKYASERTQLKVHSFGAILANPILV